MDAPHRRLMLVHAHPDDETIGNGATMAKYVAEGAAVTLVTCTLGEEGEVLVADLAHLAAEQGDELGQHRLGELKAAMDILGVTDFVRLGGDGRFRDSGMAYDDKGHATARDVLRDGIFWTTDLLEAANELVPLIRDRRPQVLVDLQPVRRLRAPGPHPGPPGGDVRRPAGRRAAPTGPTWARRGRCPGCCGTP